MKGQIKKVVITQAGKDDTARPVQQIEFLGKVSDTEIVFPYGMHANLPEDCLLVSFPILCDNANTMSIGGLPNKRIPVEGGEVVFFHPETQSKIHFTNDKGIQIESSGDINIKATGNNVNVESENVNVTAVEEITLNAKTVNINASEEINVDSPITNWTGDITQDGELTNNETTSDGIPLSTHKHDGSPTAPDGPQTDTGAPKA